MQNTIVPLTLPTPPNSALEPASDQPLNLIVSGLSEPGKNLRTIAPQKEKNSVRSVITALTIIAVWGISLGVLLSLDLTHVGILSKGVAIAFQTFLYTGLFITAHDAMHRSLCPDNPKLNDALGRVCVFLYSFFSYNKLLKNHRLHHLHPASRQDPDFYHANWCKHPLLWYFSFMVRYYSLSQFVITSITYSIANNLLHIPKENLVLFWIVPALLSSVQLFFFGTYLPHRELEAGYSSAHRAHSNSLPTVLSFLSCYHFGYHEEHHEYPFAPWWRLPAIRKLRTAAQVASSEAPLQ